MARMLPTLTDARLAELSSRAEARFYVACRDHLPVDLVVIHSARWVYRDRRGRVREGEADFTILSPTLGVFAVEVKGGGVTHDPATGDWWSVDRNGQRHRIKDPFLQATRERHALLDQITGDPGWWRWPGKRLTLGHAVVFPDIASAVSLRGPDRPREIIGVAQDLAAPMAWLERVARFWRQPEDDPLRAQGVRIIEQILCRGVSVAPALRALVDSAEQQRIRLTANQARILRVIGGRRRAVISGGAGTGKTLIAVEKARQLAAEGKRALLLCFNRPLADALAASLASTANIVVLTFHQLCDRRIRQAQAASGRDLLAEARESYPGTSDRDLFDVQMPFALALSNEVLEDRYDAIVVDEAQDFSDEYWFAVEDLLADQDQGSLFIFIDENQALYERDASLPVADAPFYLTSNCRNTAPIHGLGYQFYAGEPVDAPDLAGPRVLHEAVEGDLAQAAAIAARVGRWLSNEALPAGEIAVLLAKPHKAELFPLLTVHRLPGGVDWAEGRHGQSNSVLVETVHRFKGLEATAVVLWLGDEVLDRGQLETLYVGITRAKSLLSIVGSTAALKALAVSA